MKRFSLWLYRRYWAREIAEVERYANSPSMLGHDFHIAWGAATGYVLETLQLKEMK